MDERVPRNAVPGVQSAKRGTTRAQTMEKERAGGKRAVRALSPRARRAAATKVRTLTEVDQARRDDIIKHFRRRVTMAKNPRQQAQDRRAARTEAVNNRKTANKMKAAEKSDGPRASPPPDPKKR